MIKIIKILPCRKFGPPLHWTCFVIPGVEPTYRTQADAISYAVNCRFGSTPEGEVHVYDETGKKVVRVIKIKGGDIVHPHAEIISDEST